MKHLFNFLSFAAVAALTAISCNKELETPAVGTDDACPEGYYVEELTAVYPRDPETRTAFNETTGRFAWTEGDELAFHLSNGEYVAAPIDPATGKVKLYLPVGVTRDNYAVYPADAVVDDAAVVGNMKVTIPNSYDISNDPTTDYVPTPLVAWNDAENTHLKFEHVGGLLQVNLTVPAGVKTAKLNMGKVITGTFSLEDGTGNGIIAPGEATSEDDITFVLSESGLAEDTEVKLLAPLPTGSYEHFEVSYDNGYVFSRDLSETPWTFSRSGGKKVSISQDKFEDMTDYFWFEAMEAGSTVKMNPYKGNSANFNGYEFEYSVDNKQTWNAYSITEKPDITLENEGDRVYFRSTGMYQALCDVTGQSNPVYVKYLRFAGTGKLKVGGTIATLKNYKDLTLKKIYAFPYLFQNMTCLYDAQELKLHKYAIKGMYAYMFSGCSNLKDVMSLPENDFHDYTYSEWQTSQLATGCYQGMFKNCTSLEAALELPNTEITAGSCYKEMYQGCTSLTWAPDLTADSVAPYAYQYMFDGCTSLATAPKMEATIIGQCGCFCMFRGCKSITKAPEMSQVTKVVSQGCTSMFSGCTSLVEGPTSLNVVGYLSYETMFSGCTSLTKAPELPAMQMERSCYSGMFSNCTSLVNAPDLPATELAICCYRDMFKGCSSLASLRVGFTEWPPYTDVYYQSNANGSDVWGHTASWLSSAKNTTACKFYKPASLEIKRGTSFIPSKWTVVEE